MVTWLPLITTTREGNTLPLSLSVSRGPSEWRHIFPLITIFSVAQNLSLLVLLENIKTFVAGLTHCMFQQRHISCTSLLFSYLSSVQIWWLSQDLLQTRGCSSGPTSELRSGPWSHSSLRRGVGEGSISNENLLWCGLVSGVPFSQSETEPARCSFLAAWTKFNSFQAEGARKWAMELGVFKIRNVSVGEAAPGRWKGLTRPAITPSFHARLSHLTGHFTSRSQQAHSDYVTEITQFDSQHANLCTTVSENANMNTEETASEISSIYPTHIDIH